MALRMASGSVGHAAMIFPKSASRARLLRIAVFFGDLGGSSPISSVAASHSF